MLRWNTDKTYLRELSEAGLPVVETTWLYPGDTFAAPTTGEYVVKPAVSAGSKDTNRYVAGEHDELAADHATRLLDAGRVVMVQPYLDQVDTVGETAMLFFAGEFSHAIRKAALLEPAMEFATGAFKQEETAAARAVGRGARRGRAGARHPGRAAAVATAIAHLRPR